MKEIKCLIKLGVLEWQPLSKWAAQSFIQPKKDRMVQCLTDFRELNIRLVRKPFPLPKLGLWELEALTVLDKTWGIPPLDWTLMHPESAPPTSLWASTYKRLPICVAGSPDIFWTKMLELLATLEFIQTVLDDLLCITKGDLEDHLQRLRERSGSGCKMMAWKSMLKNWNFELLETEYSGYILTRDRIKPQANKVQAILALKPPTDIKELHFLGMVKYYHNLWGTHSELLAPLSDMAGKCSQTKVTKAKVTKKVPWS